MVDDWEVDDDALDDRDAPQAIDLEVSDDETIACPECGNAVHELSDQCPGCGSWIVTSGEKKRGPLFVGLAILLILGLLIWSMRI